MGAFFGQMMFSDREIFESLVEATRLPERHGLTPLDRRRWYFARRSALNHTKRRWCRNCGVAFDFAPAMARGGRRKPSDHCSKNCRMSWASAQYRARKKMLAANQMCAKEGE